MMMGWEGEGWSMKGSHLGKSALNSFSVTSVLNTCAWPNGLRGGLSRPLC